VTSRDHARRFVYLRRLDRLRYRHPFEGGRARRYARDDRPAFGDLDARLLDRLAPLLARARRLRDLGCGPGTFQPVYVMELA
jgi:hypothetical protein